MSITVVCTACGRNFFAPTQFAGKRVKCKGCGEIFTLPNPSSEADLTENDDENNPLAQLAAVTTGDLVSGSRSGQYDSINSGDDAAGKAGRSNREPLAPNVLTLRYPGADDVDRWLPFALIAIGFLFLLSGPSTPQTTLPGWISFTRFLAPSLLYVGFTFPITLTMLRKAAAELRYAMPPNYKLRCFASYMPAFVLMTWAQFAGEGFTIVELFAAILGLAISSALVWLFFRLREAHIGTTVAMGAGGFAAGALISGALLLGFNKIAALVVTSEHAVAMVPASPIAAGYSWPELPPPPPVVKQPVEQPKVVVSPDPVATVPSITPTPVLIDSPGLGHIDPGGIPGVIGDVIDPMSTSPFVGVLRAKQNAVSIEAWNTQTWERLPGTLQLPNRPNGNIVISTDGQQLAWIAEFPRLSVQVWSFATSMVVSTVDLDRSLGPASLVGFIGDNQLLIDVVPPKVTPVAISPAETQAPAVPPAPPPVVDPPAGPRNIFDMNPDAIPAQQRKASPGVQGNGNRSVPAKGDKPGTAKSTPSPAAGSGTATPPPSPVTETPGHVLSVVDVTSGNTLRSFNLPVLASGEGTTLGGSGNEIRYGENLTISIGSQQLAAACKINGVPSLIQFDLSTGKDRETIKVSEIDPDLSGCPTGLAYSNDGTKLAALFENGGSALLLSYDSATGKKLSGFVYPAGPLEGLPHWLFRGSAICWLDPSPFWLVYGQGIVSTHTGAHLKTADLNLSDSGQQRALDGDRVELLTNTTVGKKLYILQLDRSILNDTGQN